MYFLCTWKTEWRTEREAEREVSSLHCFTAQMPATLKAGSEWSCSSELFVLHVVSWVSSTCNTTCCLRGCISRNLDQKQNSQDLNQHSSMLCMCPKQLTHCATALSRLSKFNQILIKLKEAFDEELGELALRNFKNGNRKDLEYSKWV